MKELLAMTQHNYKARTVPTSTPVDPDQEISNNTLNMRLSLLRARKLTPLLVNRCRDETNRYYKFIRL